MLAILFAVVNASHGMEFWHTASLGGLVLCDFIAVRTVCAHHTSVNLAIVALVFTYGAGHFAQLLARHAFLRSERLEHDVHRLECLLTGPRGAQLPTVVVPTESSSARDSTTIASAPQQDDRSALSAPAATDGGHHALPAGLVLRGCPPPHTSHPSTAGPSTAADPLSASGPLCNTLSASVPLSSVSRLNSQALLNAPATSNPGPDPHPAPRTHTTPSPYLDPNPKPSPNLPRWRPAFTLSAEDIARRVELVAQMERERQEDEASQVLYSQRGDAPAQPSGSVDTHRRRA